MQTRQIQREEWRRTFDLLSSTYRGALVSIEVVGGEVGAAEGAHCLPLQGITSDRSGITIELGEKTSGHLGHHLQHPRTVRIAELDEGAVAAIEFVQEDGLHTLVQFCSPALPELLDKAVE